MNAPGFLRRLGISAAATSAVFLSACMSLNGGHLARANGSLVDIMPQESNSDPQAVAIARSVLQNDLRDYYNDPNVVVSARYFNAKGLDRDSVMLVRFSGLNTCGTMGCATLVLKKDKTQSQGWQVVEDTIANAVTAAPGGREPAFYVQGTGNAPAHRFNAVTGRYDGP